MAKKPILTDDELDGGLPDSDAAPAPAPTAPAADASADADAGATRPLDAPDTAVTRPVDAPTTPEAGGRDASGHARPKTRIHGYGGAGRDAADEAVAGAAPPVAPSVGWLVVTVGPGRGASVPLVSGMNSVGRGAENAARLDFGDDTISREPHAFVTYDDETRLFHLSHGGRTNLVRLNDAPVLTTEMLSAGDTIRIGATTLRFVALCGADFDWSDT